MNKQLILVIITWIVFVLFGGYIFTAYSSIGAAGTYVHQQDDYLKAIQDSRLGKYDHMRLNCSPNEGYKNDQCIRGMVMGHLTEALRAAYYISDEDLSWIASQYADSKLTDMFNSVVEVKYVTQYKTKDITEHELDKLVQERIMELLNK